MVKPLRSNNTTLTRLVAAILVATGIMILVAIWRDMGSTLQDAVAFSSNNASEALTPAQEQCARFPPENMVFPIAIDRAGNRWRIVCATSLNNLLLEPIP